MPASAASEGMPIPNPAPRPAARALFLLLSVPDAGALASAAAGHVPDAGFWPPDDGLRVGAGPVLVDGESEAEAMGDIVYPATKSVPF